MITKAVKCQNSKCKEVFHIADNKIPGGINDKCKVTIKCKKCGTTTTVMLHNVDFCGQTDQYEVIKIDDIDDETPFFEGDNVAVVYGFEEINKPTHSWVPSEKSPMWQDEKCNYEILASEKFEYLKKGIEKELYGWDNVRVKSKPWAEFTKVFIRQEYLVDSKICTAIWFKEVGDYEIKGADGFYLIHHSDSGQPIDGIYSRDQSLLFLERLLVRWRALCPEVIVATPFIGYDFPFSKKEDREELIALWDLLNGLLDMDKSIFFTRATTYSSLKKNQNIIEHIPAEVRDEWGLMSNLQKIVHNPKTRAKMKDKFHLKIYVGVFDDHVELYSGSFNVQTDSTMENMVIRKLSKEHFKKAYMDVMVDNYSYRDPLNEKVLLVNISKDDEIDSKVVSIGDVNGLVGSIK